MAEESGKLEVTERLSESTAVHLVVIAVFVVILMAVMRYAGRQLDVPALTELGGGVPAPSMAGGYS